MNQPIHPQQTVQKKTLAHITHNPPTPITLQTLLYTLLSTLPNPGIVPLKPPLYPGTLQYPINSTNLVPVSHIRTFTKPIPAKPPFPGGRSTCGLMMASPKPAPTWRSPSPSPFPVPTPVLVPEPRIIGVKPKTTPYLKPIPAKPPNSRDRRQPALIRTKDRMRPP